MWISSHIVISLVCADRFVCVDVSACVDQFAWVGSHGSSGLHGPARTNDRTDQLAWIGSTDILLSDASWQTAFSFLLLWDVS